uniref:Solute carrier family 17 member 9-like n=1 Tax=Phallusia mammillata TaxID=59560 RepID=A0A6F9DSY6_9ASCI|nr:solute carrier family 17 member 9-like [Phallusia mammillata]
MNIYKDKEAQHRIPNQAKNEIDTKKHWNEYERKLWTAVLFFLTATLFAARVAMPVCAAAISKEFGWNKADLGAVMGSFFWGYVTTQILGGYMADKIGGDRVLWMSSLLWSILTFFTPRIAAISSPYFNTMSLLMISRVLLGVSQGVHYPSLMSLLGQSICETKRSLPVGIVTASANFGSLVCGGVGSIILEHHGWQQTFYVTGLAGLLLTYVVRSLAEKPKHKVISIDSMVYTQPPTGKPDSVPWRFIFTQPCILAFMGTHFCMNNCFYILISWLPTFFHENFPEEKGWVYNVVPWILSIPASVLGGWISENMIKNKFSVTFTRKTLQVLAMGGTAIFGFILPFCTNFILALLCAGLTVSIQTFHNSAVLVNPQDLTPAYAGSVFGVSNAIGCIPSFLGVYITGHILDVTNSWSYVFLYMGAVNFVGATIFIFWGSAKRIV